MTPEQHYARAEELLEVVTDNLANRVTEPKLASTTALAQVHATLAAIR